MRLHLLVLTLIIMLATSTSVYAAEANACSGGYCMFNDTNIIADLNIQDGSGSYDTGTIFKFNITPLCDLDPESITNARLDLYVSSRIKTGPLDNDLNISYTRNQSITESSSASEINGITWIRETTNSTAWAGLSTIPGRYNISLKDFVNESCYWNENLTIRLEDDDYDVGAVTSVDSSGVTTRIGRVQFLSDAYYTIATKDHGTASFRPILYIEYPISCGHITSDTTLLNDLYTEDTCFHIDADGITLDCNGYGIYGNSSAGYIAINATGRNGITIKNCFIMNWSKGIYFSSTDNSLIDNVTIFNTTDVSSGAVEANGIDLDNSDNNTLNYINITELWANSTSTTNCYNGQAYGIFVDTSFNTTIKDSVLSGINGETQGYVTESCNQNQRPKVGKTIYASSSNNLTIYNSTLENGYNGIESYSFNYINVSKNTIQDFDNYGVTLETSDYPTLEYNTMIDNLYNVLIWGSISPTVIGNDISYSHSGITIAGSSTGGIINDNIINYINSTNANTGAIHISNLNMQPVDNNTLFNITYTEVSSAAIYLGLPTISSNNNLTNVTSGYSFPISSSIVYNDTMTDVETSAYIGVSATNISMYNVTFNKSSVSFAVSSSDLHVYYPVRVNVTDDNYNPLAADVNITNSTVTQPMIETTSDASGLTAWFYVEEYNQTNSGTYISGCLGSTGGINCTTPHNISAIDTGYVLNSSNFTIDQQKTVILILAAVSSCAYTGSGDWNISTACVVTSQSVSIEQDKSVNVNSNGSLTLENVTLTLELTGNGTAYIRAWNASSLVIRDVSGDGSFINTTNTNTHYNFIIDTNTTFSMTNSRIEEAGWNDNNPGLRVNTTMTDFSGNTITNNYIGITIVENNNTLLNSNISNNHIGIELDRAVNTTIDNNTVNDNSAHGIYIKSFADRSIIKNTTVSGNNRGVYTDDGTNTLVWDSVSAGNTNDLYIARSGTTTLVNTTTDKSTIFVNTGATGGAIIQWYLDLVVNNEIGTPIPQSNVSVWNNTDDLVYSQLTGTDGHITKQNITEFTQYIFGTTYATNFSVNTTKNNIVDSQQLNLTQSTLLHVILDLYFTAQIILNINNTEALVYLPVTGGGEISSGLLGSGTNYTSPNSLYLASYRGDVLTGLVGSSGLRMFASNTTNTHTFMLERSMTNTKTYLTLTQGDWRNIDRRMESIKNGDFFTEIKPTFGFGLGILYPIKMLLAYNTVDVQGNMIIHKGLNKIKIESNKTDSKAVIIERVS